MATVSNLVCGNRSYRIWNSPLVFLPLLCRSLSPSFRPPRRRLSGVAVATNLNSPLLSHLCPIAPTSTLYCLPATAGQCPYQIKHIAPALRPHLASSPHHPVLLSRVSRQSVLDPRDNHLLFPQTGSPTRFCPLFSHASPNNNTPKSSHLFSQAFAHKSTCRFQPMMMCSLLTARDRQRLCSYRHFPIVKH